MNTLENVTITAKELSVMLGVSDGFAYKIIRELNAELKKQGYIVIAGKVPRAFFETKWYGQVNNTSEV